MGGQKRRRRWRSARAVNARDGGGGGVQQERFRIVQMGSAVAEQAASKGVRVAGAIREGVRVAGAIRKGVRVAGARRNYGAPRFSGAGSAFAGSERAFVATGARAA